MTDIGKIEKTIGYKFSNAALLETAFRHSSVAKESGQPDNEKLEFLGDAVLSFIVTEYLYFNFADKSEGQLSKIKARAVSTETLSSVVESLGLDVYLSLKSNDPTAKTSKKTHANLFEALLAAVVLDGGIEDGRRFVLDLLRPHIAEIASSAVYDDYKTALQEYAQSVKLPLEYEFVAKTGPEHRPSFFYRVLLDGKAVGEGQGKNKAQAQIAAAKAAYIKLKNKGDTL